jgi:hypothetical protein
VAIIKLQRCLIIGVIASNSKFKNELAKQIINYPNQKIQIGKQLLYSHQVTSISGLQLLEVGDLTT